ncbi:hypothetical protein ILYODFUR_037238 [Ilyodon furcidens]|uniref:Uncharacterized protein n=1 Tax=Ilyodon furcidens TaxID=33524 RepID=A0ABV0UMJ0_9TELE
MVRLTGSKHPVSLPVAMPTAGDVEGRGAISVPPTGTADPSWLECTMECRDTDSEAAGTTAALAITESPATTCGPLPRTLRRVGQISERGGKAYRIIQGQG